MTRPSPGSSPEAVAAPRTARHDGLALPTATAALALLALGVWMVLDPAGFQATVGGFGTTNTHLIRDLATVNLALGGALGVAVTRPAWRVPVLSFATAQNALHLVNHVADADLAQPLWLGMANVWALVATGIVLAALLLATSRAWSRAPALPPDAEHSSPRPDRWIRRQTNHSRW